MRFRSRIKSVATLEKVCATLGSLNQIAWCRLTDEDVSLTVIPDKGSQCWSKLTIDAIFERYTVQSASAKNTINLEVSLPAFSRALRSAQGASDVWIKLTKKDNVPILSLSISTTSFINNNSVVIAEKISDEYGDFDIDIDLNDPNYGGEGRKESRQRQTLVTQDIPVKVLHPADVGGLTEPQLREPDVNIYMPNLAQLKTVSDRFTKIAGANFLGGMLKTAVKLEIRANMHGSLEVGVKNDTVDVSSRWDQLMNPELDSTQFPNDMGQHPSERMRELGGPNGENAAGWAKVRVDARDWSKVLSVGRVSNRVVGCIIDDLALVMYCWLGGRDDEEESCLTYYIGSFSA